ncbi:hypothetical protein JC2156_05520 [Weissella koreensis KCTC 3621]|uniref:hypothetical protein n=1 Tax=Weissella koreensis TaxID=165096 RepID=UPI00026F3EE2|nr:hypothetical protein [Weissella koreensis]EJF33738.1 hypothetical protein JC2156_05520 [Weissella koreensis KCTC 3621]
MMTANIIPSDPLKLKNQAKLLAGLRDQVRNLQNGIAERDERIEERDERIAELEKMLGL